MKINFYCTIAFRKSIVLTFFTLTISLCSYAQSNIYDYVLFGGFGICPTSGGNIPPAPGCGVQIGSNNTITGIGAIGSYMLIQSTGNASAGGSLYSNGKIVLSNNNTIAGNVIANPVSPSGTVLQTGSGLKVGGRVGVNGSIYIGGGTVTGTITQTLSTFTYTGPKPRIIAPINAPALPVMPAVVNFIPLPDTNISSNRTVYPGKKYNNITFSGNQTLTFADTGSYFFNSFALSGNNTIVFDFKNRTKGVIRIYVAGNMVMDKIATSFKNGGSANRVFTEANGRSSAYAFTISNGTGSTASRWFGTVWAPNSGINIGSGSGSTQFTGALWSGTQVNTGSGVTITFAPFEDCSSLTVNAGIDRPKISPTDTMQLSGTSSVQPVSYNWVAADGGMIIPPANTANIKITAAGTYILTATSSVGGCSATDTVVITSKTSTTSNVKNIIGPVLLALYYQHNSLDNGYPFYTIQQDSVVIDILTQEGKFDSVMALVTDTAYGLTRMRSNDESKFIITGLFPITKLLLLNAVSTRLINSCRPNNTPVPHTGLYNTLGDSAMRSDFIKNGYHLYGEGVKVGVISDGYNTLPGDPASVDAAINNADLPNADMTENKPGPVHVLLDFPYGVVTDEGRAMLQIVHDVAPKSKLAFRTGYITPLDMAAGIRDLAADDCDIIVDDVSHITEAFFGDGAIAQAANEVSRQGVAYFSAAGNYADKSYQSRFRQSNTPLSGLTGKAHDFGSGDIFQHLKLKKGFHTIVLQWTDSIYSSGQTRTGGTRRDLDIYLTTNKGLTRFGQNIDNLYGDPIEILNFKIDNDAETDLYIVEAAGDTANLNFKYIIFRGEDSITNHNLGTSTIVAQANADSAFTVGAVRYSRTPAFGVSVPVIESFSSFGSTNRNASGIIVRNKPDFTAPDGGETSVSFGPNGKKFFGTSAAAPHAAAVAALLIQAKKKYYTPIPPLALTGNEILKLHELRKILKNTALDMGVLGIDSITGAGFIRADKAMQSLAAADPSLIKLDTIPTGVILGDTSFPLKIIGNYFNDSTKIYLGNVVLSTTINTTKDTASVTIPKFVGRPPIFALSSSTTPSGLDGGYSDTLYFNSIVKRKVIVKAKDTTIKYGESIPVFRSSITVDGVPLDTLTKYTGLKLADIGLDGTAISYSTDATSNSSVNTYGVNPVIRTFNPGTNDSNFIKFYSYSTVAGKLTITKMPITVTPINDTVIYGRSMPLVYFNYNYDNSKIANPSSYLDGIIALHQSQVTHDGFVLIDDNSILNGDSLTAADLTNLSFIASGKNTLSNGKNIVFNGKNTVFNGKNTVFNGRNIVVNGRNIVVNQAPIDTATAVDLPLGSFFNYQVNDVNPPMVNGKNTVSNSALVNHQVVVNGRNIVVNSTSFINSENGGSQDENNIAVIIDSADAAQSTDGLLAFQSINLLTGLTVGSHYIVPGAFLSENFVVTYKYGSLLVLPDTLVVKARDTSTTYGTPPVYTSTITGYQFGDSAATVIAGGPSYSLLNVNGSKIPAGIFDIVPAGLQLIPPPNYVAQYKNGKLTVGKAPITVKVLDTFVFYNDPVPNYRTIITGLKPGDAPPTVTCSGYTKGAAPGVYTITPVSVSDLNYIITTAISGTLYVNPKGSGAKNVKPNLDCVDTLIGNPQYKYLYRFSYSNPNSTPVYVPIGDNNFITFAGVDYKNSGPYPYGGVQPAVFRPGADTFSIRANGQVAKWTLITFNGTQKSQTTSSSTSTSNKCKSGGASRPIVSDILTSIKAGEIVVYPNPVSDRLVVMIRQPVSVKTQISISDVTGKTYKLKSLGKNADGSLTYDMSNLTKGVYYVRVFSEKSNRVFKILKL